MANRYEIEIMALYEKLGHEPSAEELIEFAKDPATAWHKRFTWDDAKAAHKYRMQQARGYLAQLSFTFLTPEKKELTLPMFTSLTSERAHKHGGDSYKLTEAVISDDARRRQLIIDRFSLAIAIFDRYAHVPELAEAAAWLKGRLAEHVKPAKAGKARLGTAARGDDGQDSARQA